MSVMFSKSRKLFNEIFKAQQSASVSVSAIKADRNVEVKQVPRVEVHKVQTILTAS